MKRKALSIISAILVFITILSCFTGCDMGLDGTETGDATADITDVSDTQESETQPKKTSKVTSKTEKQETTPVPGKTKAPSPLKNKTYSLAKDLEYFKIVGRVQYTDTGILFDHCANAIEFQGYMTGELQLNANSSGSGAVDCTYFTVFVDGKRVDTRFSVVGNDKTITLATFTGNYFHTVRIIKQTEPSNSDSRLKNIIMKGYLIEPPAERKHYIEFFGDSLTAAYGNIGKPGDSNAGESIHQDATKSYAFLASEALNADCSILAKSGVGLQSGYSKEPFINYFAKISYVRGDTKFDFNGARVPDIIVIHLGANDSTHSTTKSQFCNRAKDLINYIRSGYKKKMPVIWAYDPSECVDIEWMKEVLNSYGGESAGFYLLELEWRSIGAGAGGHPSAKAHEAHAELLVNLIKKHNLLK